MLLDDFIKVIQNTGCEDTGDLRYTQIKKLWLNLFPCDSIIKDRVQELIDIIKEHKKLDVDKWVTFQGDIKPTSTTEFHACGNSACIAGYMELLPSFKAMSSDSPNFSRKRDKDGGAVYEGCLYFQAFVGIKSIALAELIVCGGSYREDTARIVHAWDTWRWEDAIHVLENLEVLDNMDLDDATIWLSALRPLLHGDKWL